MILPRQSMQDYICAVAQHGRFALRHVGLGAQPAENLHHGFLARGIEGVPRQFFCRIQKRFDARGWFLQAVTHSISKLPVKGPVRRAVPCGSTVGCRNAFALCGASVATETLKF